MERRNVLKTGGLAGLAALMMPRGAVTAPTPEVPLSPREATAQQTAAAAMRGMPMPRIKDIQVIETQPSGQMLTIVKIITDQAGLYGYGCATMAKRALLIKPAVEAYLKPLLLDRTVDRIEDAWQSGNNAAFWKNDSVLNQALSGIDLALWDIKGKMAGWPVYQLLGGKVREAAVVYGGFGGGEEGGPQGGGRGADPMAGVEAVRKQMASGVRYFRTSIGNPRMEGLAGPATDRDAAYRSAIKTLEFFRKELGDEVGLGIDIHERFDAQQAVRFCKAVEHLNLFMVEDPLSPEDQAWFKLIREQCTTPIAMGELIKNPHEWQPLIENRWIDYIRCHLTNVGGLTPCRKIALMAEQYGVKTAWHNPTMTSPIGHMAGLTLDVTSVSFGLHEYQADSANIKEVFKGAREVHDGYAWVSEKPGWGIEVDEKLAAKFPYKSEPGNPKFLNGGQSNTRLRDGSVIKVP
jgi:mannonate dehydratase